MLITLDTNVLFMALYSSKGASHRILRDIFEQKIELALSIPVFQEYEAVLTRPESLRSFSLTKQDVQSILDMIVLVGKVSEIHYLWRPNLKDEADNMFVELAVASGSSFLITSNLSDFNISPQLRFHGFSIVTPKQFLELFH